VPVYDERLNCHFITESKKLEGRNIWIHKPPSNMRFLALLFRLKSYYLLCSQDTTYVIISTWNWHLHWRQPTVVFNPTHYERVVRSACRTRLVSLLCQSGETRWKWMCSCSNLRTRRQRQTPERYRFTPYWHIWSIVKTSLCSATVTASRVTEWSWERKCIWDLNINSVFSATVRDWHEPGVSGSRWFTV
jgi:hypothetical protein